MNIVCLGCPATGEKRYRSTEEGKTTRRAEYAQIPKEEKKAVTAVKTAVQKAKREAEEAQISLLANFAFSVAP
jgi:hypothetical protein